MKNNKEFYILGLPIDTEIGQCHFIKIKELPEFYLYQNILSISKYKLINVIIENNEIKENKQEVFDYIENNFSYYSLISKINELKELYKKLFEFTFKKNIFDKVNEDNFDNLRKLIMDMNCIKEEEYNPNPEIQKWIEKSKKVKQQESGDIEFEDIITSVATYTGFTYGEILEMSIYQFYSTFYRIGIFKNYDTSCLFATVSSGKINIENWCKHIDLFNNNEKNGYTRAEYNNMKNSIFG